MQMLSSVSPRGGGLRAAPVMMAKPGPVAVPAKPVAIVAKPGPVGTPAKPVVTFSQSAKPPVSGPVAKPAGVLSPVARAPVPVFSSVARAPGPVGSPVGTLNKPPQGISRTPTIAPVARGVLTTGTGSPSGTPGSIAVPSVSFSVPASPGASLSIGGYSTSSVWLMLALAGALVFYYVRK